MLSKNPSFANVVYFHFGDKKLTRTIYCIIAYHTSLEMNLACAFSLIDCVYYLILIYVFTTCLQCQYG
jgi:hypothetical protein